jgi:hypothetical protein
LPFEVPPGGETLDAVGVLLVGAQVVPKPVLTPVGQENEGGPEILCIPAGLLLGFVGVGVFSLGFENTKGVTMLVEENVIGATIASTHLKANLLGVQQVPVAVFERLVNQDSGECFWQDGQRIPRYRRVLVLRTLTAQG